MLLSLYIVLLYVTVPVLLQQKEKNRPSQLLGTKEEYVETFLLLELQKRSVEEVLLCLESFVCHMYGKRDSQTSGVYK